MSKYFLAIFMLISYALLTGCGTKGPLYIPEQRYPQEVQRAVPESVEVSPSEVTPGTQSNNEQPLTDKE